MRPIGCQLVMTTRSYARPKLIIPLINGVMLFLLTACGASDSGSSSETNSTTVDLSDSLPVESVLDNDTTLPSTTSTTTTLAPTGDVRGADCLAFGELVRFVDKDLDGWGDCLPVTGSKKTDFVCDEGYEVRDSDRDGWGECAEKILSPRERAELITSTEPYYRIVYSYGRADGFAIDCKLTNTGKQTIEALEIVFQVKNLFGKVMSEFGKSRFKTSFDRPLKSGRSVNCQQGGYYWDLNPYDSGGAEMLAISNGRATVDVFVTKVLWSDGYQFDWLSYGADEVQIYPR